MYRWYAMGYVSMSPCAGPRLDAAPGAALPHAGAGPGTPQPGGYMSRLRVTSHRFAVASRSLREHFANTSRTLREHFTNTSRRFANTSRRFANTSRTLRGASHFAALRGRFADASRTLRGRFALASRTLRARFADASRRFALASHPSHLLCRKRRRDIHPLRWGVPSCEKCIEMSTKIGAICVHRPSQSHGL